jgi:hypothetical protein
MLNIELATVPLDASLIDALEAMAAADQQAVVMTGLGAGRVVELSDITACLNNAVEDGRDPASVRLVEASPERRTLSLPETLMHAVTKGVEFLPQVSWDQLTTLFAETSHSFALSAAAPPSRIVTASEGIGGPLQSATFSLCKCSAAPPRRHTFAPSKRPANGQCPYPHGTPATVSCGSSGTYP